MLTMSCMRRQAPVVMLEQRFAKMVGRNRENVY
jgi:hypothetical protein